MNTLNECRSWELASKCTLRKVSVKVESKILVRLFKGFGDYRPAPTNLMTVLLVIMGGIILTTMCMDVVGRMYLKEIHYIGRKLKSNNPFYLIREAKARFVVHFFCTFLCWLLHLLEAGINSLPENRFRISGPSTRIHESYNFSDYLLSWAQWNGATGHTGHNISSRRMMLLRCSRQVLHSMHILSSNKAANSISKSFLALLPVEPITVQMKPNSHTLLSITLLIYVTFVFVE